MLLDPDFHFQIRVRIQESQINADLDTKEPDQCGSGSTTGFRSLHFLLHTTVSRFDDLI